MGLSWIIRGSQGSHTFPKGGGYGESEKKERRQLQMSEDSSDRARLPAWTAEREPRARNRGRPLGLEMVTKGSSTSVQEGAAPSAL